MNKELIYSPMAYEYILMVSIDSTYYYLGYSGQQTVNSYSNIVF